LGGREAGQERRCGERGRPGGKAAPAQARALDQSLKIGHLESSDVDCAS